MDYGGQKAELAKLAELVYSLPIKWSPVNHKSGTGVGKVCRPNH